MGIPRRKIKVEMEKSISSKKFLYLLKTGVIARKINHTTIYRETTTPHKQKKCLDKKFVLWKHKRILKKYSY